MKQTSKKLSSFIASYGCKSWIRNPLCYKRLMRYLCYLCFLFFKPVLTILYILKGISTRLIRICKVKIRGIIKSSKYTRKITGLKLSPSSVMALTCSLNCMSQLILYLCQVDSSILSRQATHHSVDGSLLHFIMVRFIDWQSPSSLWQGQ